jgi:hypothetical protein
MTGREGARERETQKREGEPVANWFPVPIKRDPIVLIQLSNLRAKNN